MAHKSHCSSLSTWVLEYEQLGQDDLDLIELHVDWVRGQLH